MIFCPDDCEEYLFSGDEKINAIVGNKDRSIIGIITNSQLLLYFSHTNLLAISYSRTEDEVQERGEFRRLCWNYNSTSICILTNSKCLYIYSIDASQSSLNITSTNGKFQSSEYYTKGPHTSLSIQLSIVAKFENLPSCVTIFKSDLCVCLTDGWVHRITWEGEVLFSFRICDIPFTIDQSQERSKSQQTMSPFMHATDAVYCPLMGGICLLLSDGRAALLISTELDPKTELSAIWVPGLNNATCCEVNHKFRLLYFGTTNGEIVCYTLDDATFMQVFRIKLILKNGAEYMNKLSDVKYIRCLPNGCSFVALWDQNSNDKSLPLFAIYSTFGAQSWCSIENSIPDDSLHNCAHQRNTIEWGPEGYQLWLGTESYGLSMMNLVRSVPSSSKTIMVGNDRIYLTPLHIHQNQHQANAPHLFWRVQKLPHEYISANWPIKFVASDPKTSHIVAIAGTKGFCYFDVKVQKWRLFRKEAQEQSFFVTGGLAIYDNIILSTICRLDKNDSESEWLCAFDLGTQLDLDVATSLLTLRVLQMNIIDNRLITFDANSAIRLYLLQKLPSAPGVKIEFLAEVSVSDFLVHPMCVVAIHLMKLNYHPDAATFSGEFDSILINVAGHLLLLNPIGSDGPIHKSSKQNDRNRYQLYTPTLIASFVESIWSRRSGLKPDIPYLNKALWINMGIYTKIWLPLYEPSSSHNDGETSQRQSFLARRIMLPIELEMYPLTLDENYLACGVISLCQNLLNTPSQQNIPIRSYSICRICKVFVHCLLKQLLKRNLGNFALKIASACRSLPYFNHILELLLHSVLDEEATSIEPIPDPLLPTAVSFIHEFPEYLQTIIYTARKTELAHWNLLFSVSHTPRQLFYLCLQENLLETATAALIILQSMENNAEGLKIALELLDEALNKKCWGAARDIIRFIKGTLSDELDGGDDTPESPLYQKLMPANPTRAIFGPHKPSLPFDSGIVDDHGFNSSGDGEKGALPSLFPRTRTLSRSNTSPPASTFQSKNVSSPPIKLEQVSINNVKSKQIKPSKSVEQHKSSQHNGIEQHTTSTFSDSLNLVLHRHASTLIECYGIRDLVIFSSYVGLELDGFFNGSNSRFSVPPSSFPIVLMKLHAQFSWPYPVSEFPKNGLDRILPLTLNRKLNLNGDLIDNWSLCSSSLDEYAPKDTSTDTSTLDSWVCYDSVKNSDGRVNGLSKEAEISFVFSQLLHANAFEWAYFICLLRQNQDIQAFCSKLFNGIEGPDRNANLNNFVKNVSPGTEELIKWATEQCSAYVPVLTAFSDFMKTISVN